MTFLDSLQAHKGGLIRLKTQLYWYKGRRWDNNPGRVCLILDVVTVAATTVPNPAAAIAAATADAVAPLVAVAARAAATAHLLIDGQPAWIWVTEKDVELV